MHSNAKKIGRDTRDRVQVFGRIIQGLTLDEGFVDVGQRPAE